MKRLALAFISILVVLQLSRPLQGQPGAPAVIAGTVHTASGIAVPGAAIRVLHVLTGTVWETSTDEQGRFIIRDLPPGRYRIEAHQLGLGNAATEEDAIATQAGSKQLDLRLHTGKPAAEAATAAQRPVKTLKSNESHEVVSKSAPSNASAAAADGLVKKHHKSQKDGFKQVETNATLAANTDATPDSATLIPPAADINSQPSSAESYLISGAIGRGSTAQTTDDNALDDAAGSDNGSKKSGKHHSGSHSKSAKALAHTAPDDNLGGGIVDLAVREKIKHLGSNQMHLTLYNYYDNSKWDARNYALTGVPSPMIAHYNERFGANLGGPLVVPKLYNGKDRTFWFVNYELNRRKNAVDLFETVPLAAERSGDFCARGTQLFDPLTGVNGRREPLGCAIPASRLDPTALKVMSLIPQPNLSGLVLNYHRPTTVPTNTDIVNVRVLHSLSSRFSILGTYNLVEASNKSVTSFPSLNGNGATRDQNITLGFTQNWTPRLINETKVNFNRNRNQLFSSNAFTNNVAAQYGFTGVSTAPIDYGVPLITFENFEAITDPAALLVRNQTLRFFDNISYTMRKHNIRAGGEIRRRQLNTYTSPTARGKYSFAGLMTGQLDASGKSIPGTGLDFADFLLGLPNTTSVQFGTNSNYGRNWQFISYVQDDWRITPRFSMNYGVRYELYTPFVEKNNHLANLLVNPAVTQVAVAVPGQSNSFYGHLPNSLIRPQYGNFAPRLGIAWRPFNRGGPVVRAGYGMFYNGSIYDSLYTSMLNQPPWSQSRNLITSATQLLTLENGFPPAPPTAVTNIYGADPNYKVGNAQIWNFSLEQQFGRSYVVELLYTGTKGTHLDLVEDPNQAEPGSVVGSDQRRRIPNASGFRYETSGGNSIYNGFQARFQKRMSNGIRYQFLYTYGHSIDDASVIGVGHIPGMVQDYNNRRAERGNSFFDVRNDVRSWFFYDLPFGGRRRWLRSGVGAKLFGNWQLSANTQMNSGVHLTPFITAQNTSGVGPLFSQRPDQSGNPNLPANQRTNTRFFNVAAFSLPLARQFGNAARGTIVGPGFFNVNASFGRRMHFGRDDRYQLELRWEAQNLTNAANFSNVITVVDATDAGYVTGAKSMRSMDIYVRLRF